MKSDFKKMMARKTYWIFLTLWQFFGLLLNAQTYTFSTCGATGRLGPTQTQITNTYSNTTLNSMVTTSSGIQSWTVPSGGLYRIIAAGAKGGNGTTTTGGPGATMQGDFYFTTGQVLKIIVGQAGLTGTNASQGGGGGGSYVSLSNNTVLIVAGGGGGGCWLNSTSYGSVCAQGTISTSGQFGINGNASVTAGAPGVLGSGGYTIVSTAYTIGVGSGGGGYFTDGQNGNPANGGSAFMNGGAGGIGAASAFGIGGDGGFGGGGGGDWSNNLGGGGAGGYSGGGGGVYNGWGAEAAQLIQGLIR